MAKTSRGINSPLILKANIQTINDNRKKKPKKLFHAPLTLVYKCRQIAATLQYPSNYNLKACILLCKTMGFAGQYAAYCRPKCRVLQKDGDIFRR
jgi:hypothetical protein